MTKKIISIVAILLVLIGLSVWEGALVNSSIKTMLNEIKEVQEETKNLDNVNMSEILMMLENMDEYWQNVEGRLTTFVNYKDIREIGVELFKIKTYCVKNQVEDFNASLASIRFYLESYLMIMGASLTNVL